MNAFAKVDVETFFRFAAEHPEQRFELERGVIVQQMVGGTKRHNLVAMRIAMICDQQIDPSLWTVVHQRGVKVDDSGRYPDVVVEPADEPGDSFRTERPVLIFEVLSPSTAGTDRVAKAAEYLGIPTLAAYVIASQTEPAMLIWQRDGDGRFPSEPSLIEGREQIAKINGLTISVSLSFAEIYRGIV
jgi:Uma2 family endonuclease